METLTRYRVLREHVGDRTYLEGEEREAVAAQVAHLVPRVLEPLAETTEQALAGTAELAPTKKAEIAAPANKASGRKVKPKG